AGVGLERRRRPPGVRFRIDWSPSPQFPGNGPGQDRSAASPGRSSTMTAIPPPASSLQPHWLVRIVGMLPLAVLRAAGALLGRIVYAVSPAYRGRLLANLEQAGYGEAPAIRRRAAAEAGRMLAELPWIWARPPQVLARRMACDSLHVIEEAFAGRRGVLFLTPHIGGFEATARFCAAKWPITV